MLLLTSNNDRLQIVTGGAGTIDVHASWMDNVAGAVVPGRTNTLITMAATTIVVSSPAVGVQRNIKTLHIRNRGTGPVDITVVHTDGATTVQLYRTDLNANCTLQYVDEVGFVPVGGTASSGSGSLVLIESQTISVPHDAVEFKSGLDANYDEFILRMINVRPSIDDYMQIQISEDGGLTYKHDINTYVWAGMFGAFALTPNALSVGATDNAIIATTFIKALPNLNNQIKLSFTFPWKNDQWKQWMGDCVSHHTTLGLCRMSWGGMFFGGEPETGGINAFNAFRIVPRQTGGATTIVSGIFNLYGVVR